MVIINYGRAMVITLVITNYGHAMVITLIITITRFTKQGFDWFRNMIQLGL